VNEEILIALYNKLPELQNIGSQEEFLQAAKDPTVMGALYDKIDTLQSIGSRDEFVELSTRDLQATQEPVALFPPVEGLDPSKPVEDTEDTAVSVDPETGQKEEQFLTGDFGNFINQIPVLGDWIDDMFRAGARGVAKGQSLDEALGVMLNPKKKDLSDDEIQGLITAVQQQQEVGQSDEFNEFMEAGGFETWDGWKAFAKNAFTIAPELLVDSFASMVNPTTAAAAAAGAAATGLTSAAVGSSLGPVGSLITGTSGALSGGFLAASTALETGLRYTELLQEEMQKANLDFNKVEDVRKFLNDEELNKNLEFRSVGAGLTIGAINTASARVAGAVGARTVSNTAKALKEAGISAGGEFLGETGARAVAGQEFSLTESMLEAVGSGPTMVVSAAQSILLKNSMPQYKLNGEAVSQKKFRDFIKNSTPEDFKGADIEVLNDDKVESELEKRLEEIDLAESVTDKEKSSEKEESPSAGDATDTRAERGADEKEVKPSSFDITQLSEEEISQETVDRKGRNYRKIDGVWTRVNKDNVPTNQTIKNQSIISELDINLNKQLSEKQQQLDAEQKLSQEEVLAQEAGEVSQTSQIPVQEETQAAQAEPPRIKRGKRTYTKNENGQWVAIKKDGDLYKNPESSKRIIEELDRKFRIEQQRLQDEAKQQDTGVPQREQPRDVQGPTVSVQEDQELGEVTEEEFKDFVDSGNVSQGRINSIARKLAKGSRDFSKEEEAIFNATISEVTEVLDNIREKERQETIEEGIPWESATPLNASTQTVADDKRLAGWGNVNEINNVFGSVKEMAKKGFKAIRFSKKTRDKKIKEGVLEFFVEDERIIYKDTPEGKNVAKALRKDLEQRGGFWTLSTPERDIATARLANYRESEIKEYINTNHPDFDYDAYNSQNSRSNFLNDAKKGNNLDKYYQKFTEERQETLKTIKDDSKESRVNKSKYKLEEAITLKRGTEGKKNPDGSPRTAHPNVKRPFAAKDERIANSYKADNEDLINIPIPAGSTVETVNLKKRTKETLGQFRAREEEAINNSDAQVVRLETIDKTGRETQYIIKDTDLLPDVMKEKFEGQTQPQIVEEIKKVSNISDEQATTLSEVIDIIYKNIAKRLGKSLKEFRKSIAIKTVPKIPRSKKGAIATMSKINGLSQKIVSDFTQAYEESSKSISALFQDAFGNVKDKFVKNNKINKDDYITSALLSIDSSLKFLGFDNLTSLVGADKIKQEISRRFAEIGKRIRETDEFLIQEFSPKFVETKLKEPLTTSEGLIWEAIKNGDESVTKSALEQIQESQRESLLATFDYLLSNEIYPPSYRYLMMGLILKGNMAKDVTIERNGKQVEIKGKNMRRNNKTVGFHQELNPAVAYEVYTAMSEGATKHPMELIADSTDKSYISTQETLEIMSGRVHKKEKNGTWIKFEQSDNEEDARAYQLVSNKVNKEMGKGDQPWCTGGISMAGRYLSNGDIYVFVDKNTDPKITVRYEGGNIVEVRGTGKGQSFKDDQVDIANKFIDSAPGGESYRGEMLTWSINKKLSDDKVEDLSKEEVEFLIDDHFNSSLGTYDYDANKKYEKLLENNGSEILDRAVDLGIIKGYENDIINVISPNELEKDIYYRSVFISPETKGDLNISGLRADLLNIDNFGDFPIDIVLSPDAKVGLIATENPKNTRIVFNGGKYKKSTNVQLRYRDRERRRDERFKVVIRDNANFENAKLSIYSTNSSGLETKMIFDIGNNVSFGSNFDIPSRGVVYKSIGDNVFFDGTLTIAQKEPVKIGNNFKVATLVVQSPTVEIGNNSDIRTLSISDYELTNMTIGDGAKIGFIIASSNFPAYRKGEVTFMGEAKIGKLESPNLTNHKLNFLGALEVEDLFIDFEEIDRIGEDKILNFNPSSGVTVSKNLTLQYLSKDVFIKLSGNILYEAKQAGAESLINENGELNLAIYNDFDALTQILGEINDRQNRILRAGEEGLLIQTIDDGLALRQDKRGLIIRTDESTLILLDKDNADVTTPIHEVAHKYEDVLTKEETKTLEEWSGHKKGTRKFSEAFAKGAEKFIYEGSTFNSKLDEIFQKFKNWFRGVIKDAEAYFGDINQLNDEVRDIYAKMLSDQAIINQQNLQQNDEELQIQEETTQKVSQEKVDDEARRKSQEDEERRQSQEDEVLEGLRQKAKTEEEREALEALQSIKDEVLDNLEGDDGVYSDAIFTQKKIDKRNKDAEGTQIRSKNDLSGKRGPLYTTLRLLLPTIQNLGFKVILHTSDDSMINASIKANQDPMYTQGFLDNGRKEMHIYEKGSETTAAHEAMHPFVSWIIKNNPEVFNKFLSQLRSDSAIAGELAEFAEAYDSLTREKETVVEGLAIKLMDAFLELSVRKPSLIKRIVRAAMKMLGFTNSQTKRLEDIILKSKGDVNSFAYAMAQAIMNEQIITIDKRTLAEQKDVEASKSKRIVDFAVLPTNNRLQVTYNPITEQETVEVVTSNFIEDISPESIRTIPVDLDKVDVNLMSARGKNDSEISQEQFYNNEYKGYDFAADYEIVHEGQRLGVIEVDRVSDNVVSISSAELIGPIYADDTRAQNADSVVEVFIESLRKVIGEVVNRFRVLPRAKGLTISMNTGMGIGEIAYDKIAKIAESYGVKLRSDYRRTDAAEGLWRKLERKGKAKMVPTNPGIPINEDRRASYSFEYITEPENLIEASKGSRKRRVSKPEALERIRKKTTLFLKAGYTSEIIYSMNPNKWRELGITVRDIQEAMEKVGEKESGLLGGKLLDKVEGLTKEQQAKLKEKVESKTNYVSEKEAETILKDYGSDAVLKLLLEDGGRGSIMQMDTMVMLAMKLVKRFENEGRTEEAVDSIRILMGLANRAGRALQMFKIWRELSPEGFIYTAQKVNEDVRKSVLEKSDGLLKVLLKARDKSYDSAINKAVRKLQKEVQAEINKRQENSKKGKQQRINNGLNKLKDRYNKEQSLATGKFPDGITQDEYITLLEFANNAVTEMKASSPFLMKKAIDKQLADSGVAATISLEMQKALWAEPYNDIKIGDTAVALNGNLLQIIENTDNMSETLQDILGITEAEADYLLGQIDFAKIIEAEYKASVSQFGAKVGSAKELIAIIASNPKISRKSIEDAILERAGIKKDGLSDKELDKIREIAERLKNIPSNSSLLKDEAAAHLLSEIERAFGPKAVKYLSTKKDSLGWSLFYASILSGLGTHVLNLGANLFKSLIENAVLSLIVSRDPVTRAQGLKNWNALLRQLLPWVYGKKSSRATRELVSIIRDGKKRTDRDTIKFFDESALERANRDVKEMEGIWKELKSNPVENSKKLMAVVGKFVPRLMSGVDAYFFWANYYAKAESYTAVSLAKQGLSDKEINLEINRAFRQEFETFVEEARVELTTPVNGKVPLRVDGKPFDESDIIRRADELSEIYGARSAGSELYNDARSAATEFARISTFTQQPAGFMGVLADMVNNAHNNKKSKALAFVSKLIVPFTTVVANVTNDQLDYIVNGVVNKEVKKLLSKNYSDLANRLFGTNIKVDSPDFKDVDRQVIIKNIAGATLMLVGFAFFSAFDEDDDDALIKIHGAGPTGPNSFPDILQLRAGGWRPHSIQVGDRYYSYREVGIGLLLSLVGDMFDSKRYDKKGKSEEEIKTTASYVFDALLSTPGTILDASFLTGAADFITMLAESKTNSPEKNTEIMKKWIAGQPKFIIPNFFRSMRSSADPTWYQTKDFKDYLYKQYVWPLTGNALAPELLGKESLIPYYTSLGDKVTFGKEGTLPFLTRFSGVGRFFSIAPKDRPIYEFLREKNIYINGLGYNTSHNGVNLWDKDKENYIKVNNARGKLIKEYLRKSINGKYKRMTTQQIRADVKEAVSGTRSNSFSSQAKIQVLGKPKPKRRSGKRERKTTR